MNHLHEKSWFKMYPENVKGTIQHPEISLYTMLEKTVLKYGENNAIIFEDEQISYIQLKYNVDKLAAAWKDLGLKKGNRIGLMIPNHPYYIYSYFAAMKLGLIVVQINPSYTLRELLKIVKDSGTTYLIAEDNNAL